MTRCSLFIFVCCGCCCFLHQAIFFPTTWTIWEDASLVGVIIFCFGFWWDILHPPNHTHTHALKLTVKRRSRAPNNKKRPIPNGYYSHALSDANFCARPPSSRISTMGNHEIDIKSEVMCCFQKALTSSLFFTPRVFLALFFCVAFTFHSLINIGFICKYASRQPQSKAAFFSYETNSERAIECRLNNGNESKW